MDIAVRLVVQDSGQQGNFDEPENCGCCYYLYFILQIAHVMIDAEGTNFRVM
jgi:hypothetical protein